MNSLNEIEDFLNSECFAVVGVSRSDKKFGNVIFKELNKKGKKAFAINNKVTAGGIGDIYPNFQSLPQKADAAIINIAPRESLNAVKEAYESGIRKIWLQQGAQSPEAVKFCGENGIPVISNLCILMFASPGQFPHNLHKWFLNIFGKYPA